MNSFHKTVDCSAAKTVLKSAAVIGKDWNSHIIDDNDDKHVCNHGNVLYYEASDFNNDDDDDDNSWGRS